MKKFLSLCLISIIVFSTGCSEDDGSGSFVGVWIGDNIAVFDCDRDADNSTRSVRCDEVSCYRLTLNGDNTFSFQEDLATRTGTWSTSGGLTLTVEEDGEAVSETYTVALTSSTLAISQTNETIGCTTTINFSREVQTAEEDQGQ